MKKSKTRKKSAPPRRKKVTMQEYEVSIDKIIAKHGHIADALIEMLEYADTVEIVGVGKKREK